MPLLLANAAVACTRSQPQKGATPANAASITTASTSAEPPEHAPSAPAPQAPPAALSPPQLNNSHRLCVGQAHSCFVDAKHALWCWGGNTYGVVGNGTHGFGGKTENTDVEHDTVKLPVRVAALDSNVAAVGCGSLRTCALTLDGKIFCFGRGESPKQLELFSDVPVARDIGGRAVALALERDHACALREDHTLWCWGSNYNGQLGAGPPPPGTITSYGYAPTTQVKELGRDIVDVATFEEGTCALKNDGSLWCLGQNREGELGDGSYEKRLAPVRPGGLPKLLAVAGGKRHVCAVSLDGRLWCWGRNYEGQLGNAQTPKTKPVNYATPQLVPKQFDAIRALDLGTAETLVVDGAGDLYAFGDLTFIVRGFASHPDSTPHKLSMPGAVVEIRANHAHRCALLADESVFCWGNGEDFELGNGKSDGQADPVRVIFPK